MFGGVSVNFGVPLPTNHAYLLASPPASAASAVWVITLVELGFLKMAELSVDVNATGVASLTLLGTRYTSSYLNPVTAASVATYWAAGSNLAYEIKSVSTELVGPGACLSPPPSPSPPQPDSGGIIQNIIHALGRK